MILIGIILPLSHKTAPLLCFRKQCYLRPSQHRPIYRILSIFEPTNTRIASLDVGSRQPCLHGTHRTPQSWAFGFPNNFHAKRALNLTAIYKIFPREQFGNTLNRVMSHEGVNQEKFILHSQHLFEDALCIEMLISHIHTTCTVSKLSSLNVDQMVSFCKLFSQAITFYRCLYILWGLLR